MLVFFVSRFKSKFVFLIFMTLKQMIDGKLCEITESCAKHAALTFDARRSQDTNQMIVQMIVRGNKIPHWYYRSNEWVEQPYSLKEEFVDSFVGPAPAKDDQLAEIMYSIQNYEIAKDLTDLIEAGKSPF